MALAASCAHQLAASGVTAYAWRRERRGAGLKKGCLSWRASPHNAHCSAAYIKLARTLAALKCAVAAYGADGARLCWLAAKTGINGRMRGWRKPACGVSEKASSAMWRWPGVRHVILARRKRKARRKKAYGRSGGCSAIG